MGLLTSSSLCLLGILVASSFLRAEADCCARGWAQSQGNCYKLFEKKLSWAEAEVQCQRHGPAVHLASILTKAETQLVSNYISKHKKDKGPVWIGLRDYCENRLWKWSDRSPFSYTAWAKNEPNNAGGAENCVELLDSTNYKEWNDKSCETLNVYICKHKLGACRTTLQRLL